MKKGYLVLEDGTVFEGLRFGADCSKIGELVFNTNVVGYIETLTDPSYYGQIILQTFPMIGNYGIIEEDFVDSPALCGYVVREWCEAPSNFRSQYTLDAYLKKKGIPGLYGVDTREITKILRDRGVMNAMICDEIPKNITNVKSFTINAAVSAVTKTETVVYPAKTEKKYRVTLVDYGSKGTILSELQKRGCEVTTVPYCLKAEDILASDPDGIVLSGGPGDPAENTECIEELKKLLGKKPIFGIALGHQLLALALGAKTQKLKYGHRGGNQPVKDLEGTRTYITSQNHGYAVVSESVSRGTVRFVNANDQTCEGIDYPDLGSFSTQFYPDAVSGPWDTSFLYDQFIRKMGGK